MNIFKRAYFSVLAAMGSKTAHAIEHDVAATLAPVVEAALQAAASPNPLAAAAVAGIVNPAINRAVKSTEPQV